MDLTSILVGGLVGFTINFLGGFSKEFFDKRSRIDTHKRNVASKVLEICHKDRRGFSAFASNSIKEKIALQSTITDLVAIDIEAGRLLKRYSDITFAGPLATKDSKIELDLAIKSLIAWANKIRVG